MTTGSGTGGANATGGTTGTGAGGTHTGGTTGSGTGGNVSTGGTTGNTGGTTGNTGGTTGNTGGTIGNTGGTTGTGGSHTGGTTGNTGGTTGGTGGTAGGSGCANTNTSAINEDASGYVCNNTFGIKGAWYCYNGPNADSSSSCKGSNGLGMGAIPWNTSSAAMCMSGTVGQTTSGGPNPPFAGIGFKVNSGPPGSSAAPGTYDASQIVGFAITFAPGPSGQGSNGSVLSVEFPTSTDVPTTGPDSGDAPGVTVPGVAGTPVTYNVLFSDAVISNDITERKKVDPANLTDLKVLIPPDAQPRAYDFCITKVVPLTTAPAIATGNYGLPWQNLLQQAVNGINGYAVQNTPFAPNGLAMSMQVTGGTTSGDVGFQYTAKAGSSGNGPAAFPAIISGWGPGSAGIQLYGAYQANKTISALTSVKSSWSFTPGSSGDSAYDIWLGTSAAPTTAPAVELMVWLNNGGKSPLGNTKAATAVTGSDGVARFAHTGQANSTGQQVVSYVPDSGSATSVTNLNLLQYLNDAVANGYAGLNKDATKVYLLGVQAGFEVYSADTWKTTDYNITIN